MNKKLLIVIPYRERANHLCQLIPYLKNKLFEQKIEYTIVVVEQDAGKLFNRGMLCNIGFYNFYIEHDYVCFHDVDMLCDNIDYSYCNTAASLIKTRTKKHSTYHTYFGGITLFNKEIFIKINGFSNKYWGWGAEDDDVYKRCLIHNIRPLKRQANCIDLELISNELNRINNPNYSNNLQYLLSKKTINSIKEDGVCQVSNLYKIIDISKNQDFNMCKVQI